jgi:hypothetical protein
MACCTLLGITAKGAILADASSQALKLAVFKCSALPAARIMHHYVQSGACGAMGQVLHAPFNAPAVASKRAVHLVHHVAHAAAAAQQQRLQKLHFG